MFRSPEYCDRYEYIPLQLDTPITTPGAGVAQRKNGYQFTINDSKKISNDQELIQSDPISCPQNQKGNN